MHYILIYAALNMAWAIPTDPSFAQSVAGIWIAEDLAMDGDEINAIQITSDGKFVQLGNTKKGDFIAGTINDEGLLIPSQLAVDLGMQDPSGHLPNVITYTGKIEYFTDTRISIELIDVTFQVGSEERRLLASQLGYSPLIYRRGSTKDLKDLRNHAKQVRKNDHRDKKKLLNTKWMLVERYSQDQYINTRGIAENIGEVENFYYADTYDAITGENNRVLVFEPKSLEFSSKGIAIVNQILTSQFEISGGVLMLRLSPELDELQPLGRLTINKDTLVIVEDGYFAIETSPLTQITVKSRVIRRFKRQ